jgi:hypothetical protein
MKAGGRANATSRNRSVYAVVAGSALMRCRQPGPIRKLRSALSAGNRTSSGSTNPPATGSSAIVSAACSSDS